jgi:hypothetical protein
MRIWRSSPVSVECGSSQIDLCFAFAAAKTYNTSNADHACLKLSTMSRNRSMNVQQRFACLPAVENGYRFVNRDMHRKFAVARRQLCGSFQSAGGASWQLLHEPNVRTVGRKARYVSGLPILLGKSGRLPCSGFGLGKFWDNAELLHKSESVPIDPSLGHPAVRETDKAYAGDVELLTRWGDPAEIAFMSTATGPTSRHCLAIGSDVVDRQLKVREGGAV